jgi:hypothetical protein
MQRKRRMPPPQRLVLLGMVLLSLGLYGFGCKEDIPVEGVFPIKVIAWTSDKVGIPGAKVFINDKLLGSTDKFGAFVGTYPGKVNEKIQIKVVAQGKNNFMRVKSKLRMRKAGSRWIPAAVKVEAYLRPSISGGLGTPPALAGGPGTQNPPAMPGTRNPVAPRQPDPPPTSPRQPDPPPAVAPRQPDPPPAVAPRQPDPPPAVVPRRVDPPPVAPRQPDPPPPRIPSFDGRYVLTVSANVDGVKVYVRGRQRRSGYIRQGGGALKIKYRDRSKSPRTVKVTFTVRRQSWKYKARKIEKEITIQYGQREYSVEANFEKKPPRKIMVKANMSGIKVYMNGKMSGEIQGAGVPLTLEYEGRSRSVRIEMRPADRKIKPRRFRKRVRFQRDVYEYTVEKEFVAPAPVIPRAPAPPAPPLPGGGTNNPGNPVAPPPARRRNSGIYRIQLSANADNVTVYKGRRRVGVIRQAGGTLNITHRDRRSTPRDLSFRFRVRDRYAYMQRTVTKRLTLEAGREDGYSVQGEFVKRKPIKISVTSTASGARVYLQGKAQGSIVAAGQALVVEYSGRPKRSLRIEVRSPNPKAYTPSRIRKTIRIRPGTFEYSVAAPFKERDVSDGPPITPRCFRRSRRKRVAVFVAPPKTTIILIGDCNNEQLAKTGRSGKLKVNMPGGTFQRVKAVFPGGASIKKVIEVPSARGSFTVRLRSGGKRCNLRRIHKKVKNGISLESEEVACLQNVKKANPQYFASLLSYARYQCTKRRRRSGASVLKKLSRDPSNRFNPYRALQMGIEFGRCRQYSWAIRMLKQAERLVARIPPVDRYANKTALYRSMSQMYEQRYYRKKNLVDLTRALKLMQRLKDISRSNDRNTRSFAGKEVARLKKLVAQRGGGLDE